MNLGHVSLTVRKELRETLRDRRTLAVMILFPLVVYPLLSLLAVQASASRQQARQARPSRVAISDGTPANRQLVETLLREKADEFTLTGGEVDDVARGRLDALVQLHETRADIAFDASRDDSRQAADRLQDQLATLRPPDCAPRFSVERHSITAQAQLGGYLLSKALPLLMVLMVLMGAFYPAIDATAGERERGTLETILSSPIARFDLLLGKVLAVGLLAAASGVINLASLSATLIQAVKLAEPTAAVPMPWDRLLAATLVIAPAAFLFASAFVALGALARTSKEAQNLLMPVYLVAVAPAVAGTLGEFSLQGWVAWTPVMNITLLARDLLLGRAAALGTVLALGSTTLFGVLALAGAARIYTSERFVDPGPRASRAREPVPLTAGHAFSLYGIAFILLYFLWLPLERRALALGLLVADWAGLLGLVVVFAWLVRQPVRDLLHLRRAPGRAWMGATLIGLSAWAAVSALSQWINPAPKELLEQMRRLLIPEGRSLLATLGLVALTPAVCEEALFRGPILRGLRSQLSPAASVLLTGLLFGLFHLDVARILPASLLGVLLSFIALESGSILPAMLAHFTNNAILVVLSYYRLDERLANVTGVWAVASLVASVVLTSLGIGLVRGSVKADENVG
jgi:sodium transport system permease protein